MVSAASPGPRAGTTTAPVSVTPTSQSSSITPPAGTVTNQVSTSRVSSSLRVISAPGACSRAVTSELPKVTVSPLGSSAKRTGSSCRPTLIDSIGVRSLVSSIRTSVVTDAASSEVSTSVSASIPGVTVRVRSNRSIRSTPPPETASAR